jgi:hypothetical protein
MMSKEMLLEAADLVGGQKAAEYGDITELHKRIAALWMGWIEGRHGASRIDLDEYDVAIMMVLLKIARLVGNPGHRDSHIDIAGYAAVAEEIATKTIEEQDKWKEPSDE